MNNLRLAFRYLLRNKVATAINVTGLSVALSAAFLMLQYLDFELSYDTYLPEHNEVYRITTTESQNGAVIRNRAETYHGVADWTTQNFSEVEAATRFYFWPAAAGLLLENEGKLYSERRYLFADEGFFQVFPSLLVAGDAKTCLAAPNNVILSERLAMKMFGTTDVIGKTVANPERRNKVAVITGIMRHTPANSQFDADAVYRYEWTIEEKDRWIATSWTYVRLRPGTSAPDLQEKINKGIASELAGKAITSTFSLQPMASIHLQSSLEGEIKTPGNMLYIYILIGALSLIMLVAWVNYVNLETARFIRRLKEVGIRRIVGSSKSNLLSKFLTEYLVVTLLSIVTATLITSLVFPYFGFVTGLPITTPAFNMLSLWFGAVSVFLVATFATGAYPFLVVVKVNPVASLKGKISENFQGTVIRKSLLTFQFVASLSLMALVVVASFQLDFMRKLNKNFDGSSVVTIFNPANYTWMEDSLRHQTNDVFRNRLLQIPAVNNLTTSSAIIGEEIGFTYVDLAKRSLSEPDRQVPYKVMYVDYDFLSVFGLELVAGRNYSPASPNKFCLVVTESAARELGFSSASDILNQEIYFQEDDEMNDWDWHKWKVIGVVKDYRHESAKTPIKPAIFRLHRNQGQMIYYSIKLEAGSDPATALPAIEQLWKETWPGKPFDFFFMDQHYDQQYKSEIHFSRVFLLFSGVAVFIACLGVMGMSLFEANARMKEISIRKVLGAQVVHIVALLTKDSFRVLFVSFAIALPIVYLLASRWLSEYPERIGFSAWFFALPLGVMCGMVSSVSLTQVIKAARRNPVESLKQE